MGLSKEQRTAVESCLMWLKQNSTRVGPGTFDIGSYPGELVAVEVIKGCIPVEKSMPESTHRRAVDAAIMRWLEYKKYRSASDPVDALFKALEIEIRHIKHKSQSFTVLMFLNLRRSQLGGRESVHILGKTLDLPTWNELRVSMLDIAALRERIHFHQPKNPVLGYDEEGIKLFNSQLFTPVVTAVEAYDYQGAIEIARARFDLFRAILTMAGLYGVFVASGSIHESFSNIRPTPVYAAFGEAGELAGDFSYTPEKLEYRPTRLQDSGLKRADILLARFESPVPPKSTLDLVGELLRRYQEALDSQPEWAAFLGLWQVLEGAALLGDAWSGKKKPAGKIQDIVLVGTPFKEALPLIEERRHSLVHSAEFPDYPGPLISLLKRVVEAAINNILNKADEYPTIEELKLYLQYVSVNDKELAREKRVIDQIVASREMDL